MIVIDFASGAELYFDTQKMLLTDEQIQQHGIRRIKDLISYLYTHYPKCRRTIFKDDLTLTGGILCCINDVDWGLKGEEEAVIENGESVLFLSTLHGG